MGYNGPAPGSPEYRLQKPAPRGFRAFVLFVLLMPLALVHGLIYRR